MWLFSISSLQIQTTSWWIFSALSPEQPQVWLKLCFSKLHYNVPILIFYALVYKGKPSTLWAFFTTLSTCASFFRELWTWTPCLHPPIVCSLKFYSTRPFTHWTCPISIWHPKMHGFTQDSISAANSLPNFPSNRYLAGVSDSVLCYPQHHQFSGQQLKH